MDLENVKGLGEKTIILFKKLGISTIEELVTYYPYRYDILKPGHLENCISETGIVNAKIIEQPKINYFKRNFNRLNFRAICEGKIINVVIFNRGFLKPHLQIDKNICLIGKYDREKNIFTASDIRLEVLMQQEIVSVYHLINGITNKQVSKIINNILETKIDLEDYIPDYLNEKYGFIKKIDAVREIHKPSCSYALKMARLKLIYEEFFVFMFKMNYLKKEREKKAYGLKRSVLYDEILKFVSSLPFKLTDDQMEAVLAIYNDLVSAKRMNRLLLGDVGSGKTIVSVVAMVINTLAGYQSSLMAPTEVLAIQHYENIKKMLPQFKVGLLVGSMSVKEKKKILKELGEGNIDILIGTHAILSDNVLFANLGLVITDEQHRFGVNQRKTMQNKGKMVDVLYMSATPIPRTYALALYGDMDLSTIKTKPNGRKEIITKVVLEKNIKVVLEAVWEELKLGHQIYVVAPLIEDDESNLNDVNKLKENFSRAFVKAKIAILHGKMKKQEKNQVMEEFKNGKVQILISTTVIEVGVDVKNSTMMVIYNAERFGLATLHQLRGRVGRNDMQSYCYLVCNREVERLKVLEESNDGFYISERDFEMRGEGDLFGVRQSGDMVFKIGDIRRDSKILLQCKKDAMEYLEHFDNNKLYLDIIDGLEFNN